MWKKRFFLTILLLFFILMNFLNNSYAINNGSAFIDLSLSNSAEIQALSPDENYIYYKDWTNIYRKWTNGLDSQALVCSWVDNTWWVNPVIAISPDWNTIICQIWYKLYKKWVNDSGNGVLFSWTNAFTPTFSPDGQYVYFYYNWLTRKWINEVWNWTSIATISTPYKRYIAVSNNYIIYNGSTNSSDLTEGESLYKKWINEVWNWIKFTNWKGYWPRFSIDWNYLYHSDGWLYRKWINDSGNWTLLANSTWTKTFIQGNYIYYTCYSWWWQVCRASSDWSSQTIITDIWVAYDWKILATSKYVFYNDSTGKIIYRISLADESNWSYQHYILNRLTATEGNMKNLNNISSAVSFSNYNAVKNNFLANYQYRKSWYESKWITAEVLSKNVKWNEWVIFSKNDIAWWMLSDYKLSATYDFASDDEMDNVDSSIFWRWNLSNTSFQTDANWNTVGLPAYIIRNQNWNIVWYLEYPCWNLICKDKGCTDIKNIVNGGVTVNKAPTPTFNSFSVNKNAKYVSVLTATDPEKDTLTYSKTINANHWTVVILSNGTFGYLPVTNYVWTDTFTYSVSDGKNPWVSKQVNITVNDIVPLNNPPVPTFSSFYTNKNITYNWNLTATDSNWDTLTYNVVTTSKKWTLNVSSNWSFSYIPNSYYVWTDSFIYSVTDWKSTAVTKTVNIMVNDYIPWNVAPTPIFSSLTTNKNIKYSWVLTSTDPDWWTLYYNLVSNPSNGSITLGNNGNFSYIPSNNYVWSDSFIYSVSDWFNSPVQKLVSIQVNDIVTINNPPVPTFNSLYTNKDTSYNWNLTASDIEWNAITYSSVSNPSYWTINISSNWSFSYTPNNWYVGSDSFIYSVSDWFNSPVQKLVSIQVNDMVVGNNPPIVDVIPPITVDKNTPVNTIIDTTDPDWDTIIYTPITEPSHWTVIVDNNWNINYIPNEWFSGTDTITVWISDWINPPVERVISIIVNDPIVWNFPPVAIFSNFSTWKNKAYSDNLTATDPENDNLTYSLLSQPLNGTININQNWSFSYTPNNGYSWADTFTYAVFDWHNNPVSWTVNITIIPSIDTVWDSPTPPNNDKDIFCTATNNWTTTSKTILVINPKADTKFIQDLKWKSEYLKTISSSWNINNFDKIVEDVIKEKVKTSKVNQKSNLYDFWSWWTITGIQYNLTKIPNSAVMRKLVDLAIDHSTLTMSNYIQTMKDNCSTSNLSNSETIPAWFVEVNDKGETILNLFRFNWE